MSEYPERVVIEKGVPAYDFLMQHSAVLKNLFGNSKGEITLGDWLFPDGDNHDRWELFYDLFFYENAVKPLFVFKKTPLGAISLALVDEKRSIGKMIEIFDYLGIGKPEEMAPLLVNLIEKHKNASLDIQQNTVKRKPKMSTLRMLRLMEQQREQEQKRLSERILRNLEKEWYGTTNTATVNQTKAKPALPAEPAIGLREEEELTVTPSLRKYITSNLKSRKGKKKDKKKRMFVNTRRAKKMSNANTNTNTNS